MYWTRIVFFSSSSLSFFADLWEPPTAEDGRNRLLLLLLLLHGRLRKEVLKRC